MRFDSLWRIVADLQARLSGVEGGTVEVNLASSPAWRGTFTIANAAIDTTSRVFVRQAAGPYTGKGTRADEAEMDLILCVAQPLNGSASVSWRSVEGWVSLVNGETAVRGKVKGNVKFNYQIVR